jgi:hypothetical protein
MNLILRQDNPVFNSGQEKDFMPVSCSAARPGGTLRCRAADFLLHIILDWRILMLYTQLIHPGNVSCAESTREPVCPQKKMKI